MGAKQSNTAATNYTTTKRKRSNTQASNKPLARTLSENNSIKFDKQKCEQLFLQYADPDSPTIITPDGTRQFFEDLGLSIEDVLIFAIAWKMHTSTMGYITKEEWIAGMKELETDSLEKLQAKRPEFETVFTDPVQFKEMYKYTFSFAKNRDQKCMDVETACVLWTMLLADKYPIVEEFVRFLQEKKPVKVINKDQWQNFLEFVFTDISTYDESSAWPVLFDEFVEWKQQQ